MCVCVCVCEFYVYKIQHLSPPLMLIKNVLSKFYDTNPYVKPWQYILCIRLMGHEYYRGSHYDHMPRPKGDGGGMYIRYGSTVGFHSRGRLECELAAGG